MGKVVIERSRGRALYSYKDVRNLRGSVNSQLKNLSLNDLSAENDDIEDALDHIASGGIQKLRQVYSYDRKVFSDLLGPIYRYLYSKCGTRWDEVWSDVCTNLRGAYAVEHVREHVEQMVEFEGVTRRRGYQIQKDIMYGSQFYVDKEGRLQAQIKKSKKPKTEWLQINKINFYKKTDERFWICPLWNRSTLIKPNKRDDGTEIHLNEEQIRYNMRIENFKLLYENNQEYIYLIDSWFKFEYRNLKDLHLNSDISVGYSITTGKSFIKFYEYDIFGNRTTRTAAYGPEDLNSLGYVIRIKMHQLNHNELKKFGLTNG